ncbi:MAG: DUF3467 domain-containing protein [Caulobacteraceae bacterium]
MKSNKPSTSIEDPKYANTFRTSYTETEFNIDFGYQLPGEDQINVVSKVAIPTKIFTKFIVTLFQTAIEYEKQFDTDIGFGSNKEGKQEATK